MRLHQTRKISKTTQICWATVFVFVVECCLNNSVTIGWALIPMVFRKIKYRLCHYRRWDWVRPHTQRKLKILARCQQNKTLRAVEFAVPWPELPLKLYCQNQPLLKFYF